MLPRPRVTRLISGIGVRRFADAINSSLQAAYVKGDARRDPVNVLPKSKYGGINTVSLLTASTIIGEQGANFVTSLVHSTGVPVEVQVIEPGNDSEYFNSVLRNRSAVCVDILADAEAKQKALKLCNDLNLYVFKTRTRSFPGFNCRFPNVDIQMIGENNMGNYNELEYSPVKGVVEALCVVTQARHEKYLKYAFEAAVKAGRKRVTLINKAKEWPISDGSMVEVAKQMHSEYEDCLELELMEVDEAINRLTTDPTYFDCLFASDRYATFLSAICSAVCGGANLFSAVEIGDHHAIFKPLQTKLSLTYYNNLSAYGIVSTIVDLLEHLGHSKCSHKLWCEMLRTMYEGIRTKQFGGKDTDEYVICNIINQLRCQRFGESKK
ncbi:probable isocitrate dehydrogenase [NAD] gamma 2, mitochondrial [Drosophila ficusphila]|uniref:probable isocitrate dehydrogenase [NAD] gamma 2, mitochondrial n=1 Tax=Drosophila ficusphila TaxID=30025 RepID=UPI0007E7A984|nr:probable isocitrate dehydrogenase [NAD] gamma 2, mitochondrial [Drosophila ficusphila]